jgi:sulfate transport system permease protein
MGLTLSWLSVIILIPLAGLFLKSLELSPNNSGISSPAAAP